MVSNKNKTLKVSDIDELIEILLHNLDREDEISLVSDFDTVWAVASELYTNGVGDFVDIQIDTYGYDKEYYLTLINGNDIIDMSIEQAYVEETGHYLGSDGLVFVDANCNSKYIIQCSKNDEIVDFTPVVFELGDWDEDEEDSDSDVCDDCHLTREQNGRYVVYTVPVCFDFITDTFDEMLNDFCTEIFE